MEVRAFYGSTVPIEAWDPRRTREFGYHFGVGSPAASLHRLRHLGGGHLYEVEVTYTRALEMRDPFYWDLAAVAGALGRGGEVRALKGEASRRARAAGTPLRVEENAVAGEVLDEAGYDAITYDNEGEGGGPAIVVWHPEQIATIRELDPTVSEGVGAPWRASRPTLRLRLGELRRIIREVAAGPGDGVAALVTRDGRGGFKATVYDPIGLEDVLLGDPHGSLSGCIVGRIHIVEPHEPCWGAMRVASVVGPGRLMYGLGYALSPSGLLISDRESMTPKAVDAWRAMSAKGERGRRRLDDIDAPKTRDPRDDCTLRREEFLNYAYEETGEEDDMLLSMQGEHERLMDRVTRGGDVTRGELEAAIAAAGFSYFQSRLPPKG